MRQGDLFGGYPDHPGHKVGGTSEDAAADMAGRAATLRGHAYRLLSRQAMTADECAAAMGESVLAIRPRLSELRVLGMIVDTRQRRRNRSGKFATVWAANAP